MLLRGEKRRKRRCFHYSKIVLRINLGRVGRVGEELWDNRVPFCFLLANHNDWTRWFAVSSPHLFQFKLFSIDGAWEIGTLEN